MIDSSQITEHMEVLSSDGKHVGRVDHVRGSEIELAKMDLQAMGKHHLIPTYQPQTDGTYTSARRKNSTATPKAGRLLTQHTGLPPRKTK